jgi:long-chain-alcohol oxidase
MCLREAQALVRTLLWLLGTRLGTLALCGARCLSPRFPFVRRFAEMPVERREDALRRWSRETVFPPLRLFFLLLKVFCLYVFYSLVSKPVRLLTKNWYCTRVSLISCRSITFQSRKISLSLHDKTAY